MGLNHGDRTMDSKLYGLRLISFLCPCKLGLGDLKWDVTSINLFTIEWSWNVAIWLSFCFSVDWVQGPAHSPSAWWIAYTCAFFSAIYLMYGWDLYNKVHIFLHNHNQLGECYRSINNLTAKHLCIGKSKSIEQRKERHVQMC